MNNYKQFMIDSNCIEGEDRLNPGDLVAIDYTLATGLEHLNEILEVHRILTLHLEVEWCGKWRTCDVQVGGYTCPSHVFIPSLMDAYINTKMQSWETHNRFQKIHPFQDFNGRVGRLIWLAKAIKEGYNFTIPFLQKYYYQTLKQGEK